MSASISTVSLEWRRGNSGSWTVLSSSTSTPSSYTHSLTDSNYNASQFNYRYVVTDSVGGTKTSTLNITPSSYVNPSVSLTTAGVSLGAWESNTSREIGNVDTNISGSITRNSSNVALSSYILQYSVDNGAWTDIGSSVSIGPGTSSISLVNHNPVASNSASSIRYRVEVVDDYQTYLSSQVYSSTYTINFYYVIFYGTSSSGPANSTQVRGLGNKIFTTGSNPFNLLTGTVDTYYTVAVPASISVTDVVDLDALNANITSNYISSTFNISDAGSTNRSYKIYTMSNATPYTASHRHQITRA